MSAIATDSPGTTYTGFRGFGSLLRAVLAVLEHLAGLTLAANVLVVFLSVIYRYFLHDPLDWAEEVARALMVVLVFFGAATVLGLARMIMQEGRTFQGALHEHAAALHRVHLAPGQVQLAQPIQRPRNRRLGHVQRGGETAHGMRAVGEIGGQEDAELPGRKVGAITTNQCDHGVAQDLYELISADLR